MVFLIGFIAMFVTVIACALIAVKFSIVGKDANGKNIYKVSSSVCAVIGIIGGFVCAIIYFVMNTYACCL